MWKFYLLLLAFFNISLAQTSIDQLFNSSWNTSKKQFLTDNEKKIVKEKESMGYSGYVLSDTLENCSIDIGYFFDSSGIQKMRGITNKVKSELESKRLFDQFLSILKKLSGNPISDNEMLGSRMMQWKVNNHTVILTYKSDTCMLSIIK